MKPACITIGVNTQIPALGSDSMHYLCRRIVTCRIFLAFGLFVVIMFGLSCSKSKTSGSYHYHLSKEGYSPDLGVLLFAVDVDLGEPLKGVLLGIYSEKNGQVKYLSSIGKPGPFDFAWSSKRDEFAVTHGDRMSLFQKSVSSNDYLGTAIRHPLGVHYTYCAWNPTGDWLAVICWGLKRGSGHWLGLYNLMNETFVLTDIVTNANPPVWKDNMTLYVPNDDGIVEVRLDAGKPKPMQTIPVEKESLFYGVFNDLPLVQKDNKVKLGSKMLVELSQASRASVISTQTCIFVAASPTSLVVFNHDGHELCRTNPKKIIRFGSVGENSNTVYGLAGSTLLRIYVENGILNTHRVCDLADFK